MSPSVCQNARVSIASEGYRGALADALGYRPALDGLRGVAVAMVLVGHLGAVGVARAATSGVTLFFVLSGFLITRLLMDERARVGRVNFHRFYIRRALRLMPALVAVLAVFGVYSVVDREVSAPIVIPALYLSNFVLADGGSLGVFDHLWSLAMEEQFYLVWPLLLVVSLRRSVRTAVVVAATGAALSMTIAVTLAATHHEGVNWTRIRFGPDTRAHGLLLGCLIALLPSLALRVGKWRVLIWPAVAMVVVASLQTDGSWLQHLFWRPMVAVAGVVLVANLLDDTGRAACVAASPPLVALGRISYGLYLWHFPIYRVLSDHLDTWPFATRSLLLATISIAVAAVSYVAIERPFLRLKLRFAANEQHNGNSTIVS